MTWLADDLAVSDAIRQNANAASIKDAAMRIKYRSPVALMHPNMYRRLAVYLAFSEAWRQYGKTLGYS